MVAISACFGTTDAKMGGGDPVPAVAAADATATFDVFTKNWSAEQAYDLDTRLHTYIHTYA